MIFLGIFPMLNQAAELVHGGSDRQVCRRLCSALGAPVGDVCAGVSRIHAGCTVSAADQLQANVCVKVEGPGDNGGQV